MNTPSDPTRDSLTKLSVSDEYTNKDLSSAFEVEVELIKSAYEDIKHELNLFMYGVERHIGEHPMLTKNGAGIVHSYKSRLKDVDHLAHKIMRKRELGRPVDSSNFFDEITDLAGVRILHLFQSHFAQIDAVIRKKVEDGDWHLAERPKAYTWDPEAAAFFGQFDVDVSQKETSYTSIHYLIKPREESKLCCEVQVRILFEEIWGEVDHQMNYPDKSTNISVAEQIKVLSKIVGAGSRLLDSLQRVGEA